jgi:helicase
MYKAMKIKDLKNYKIPSCVLDIWEEHYSPCLLPLQEEAVRNYGILDCGEGSDEIAAPSSKARNDRNNNNLLVIAPPSSGKSFLGEMAAIAHLIHQKKCIYLAPFRFYAEEKYSHLKNLYGNCGAEIIISTRNRKEDDCRIMQGGYKLAVMDYEKFNYFLLMYPEFLTDVSLVIIDEMQIIDDPQWGPLLEEIIDHLLKKDLSNLRIIALSALIENQDTLLKWFPAHPLISYPQPAEIRKGVVREGVFKYTTSKEEKTCRREIFFKPDAVRDNCFEDYLLETVRYLIRKDEPTLIFFATCAETRKWAGWLASRLESPAASCALKEIHQMEDTLSRKELSEVLEKGVAYHNPELSWEERNLVETHLKKGEIKIVCASTKYSIGINLPFKNIIIPSDKIHNNDGNYLHDYRTGLTFTDIENMGGRAANSSFGRIIFLAYSLLSETIHQNIYFNSTQGSNMYKTVNRQLIKEEEGLLTYLLRLSVKYQLKPKEIKEYLKEGATHLSGYWQFSFKQENLEEKISKYLNILKGNKLIREIKGGILSPTANGILITALKIKVETYLFLKYWMGYCKKGGVSELEILLLLAFSADGRALPVPFSQFYKDDEQKGSYSRGCSCRGNYRNKLLHLVIKQGDEDKKLYRDKIMLKKVKEEALSLEDYLAIKKTCLLYDWIKGDKDIKTIEQENGLCGGAVQVLGEGFSWLADSLMEIAKNEGWKIDREEDLNKIKILSERLVDGVEEEGLSLSRMHIPGLSRYYIRRLVGAGYGDVEKFKNMSGVELGKLLPKILVQRIQKRMNEEKDIQKATKQKLIVEDEKLINYKDKNDTENPNSNLKNKNQKLKTVLEISLHRPDRIIFEREEIKVTAKVFSLIYLLAKNRGKILTHNDLLATIWKESEDATYIQITYHLYKIRRDILKIIGNNKKNKERVKDILKVISRRGIMLNLTEDKLKIN